MPVGGFALLAGVFISDVASLRLRPGLEWTRFVDDVVTLMIAAVMHSDNAQHRAVGDDRQDAVTSSLATNHSQPTAGSEHALPAAAATAEVSGLKLADTAKVGGVDLVFNGGAVRSKVIFKVYVASLLGDVNYNLPPTTTTSPH